MRPCALALLDLEMVVCSAFNLDICLKTTCGVDSGAAIMYIHLFLIQHLRVQMAGHSENFHSGRVGTEGASKLGVRHHPMGVRKWAAIFSAQMQGNTSNTCLVLPIMQNGVVSSPCCVLMYNRDILCSAASWHACWAWFREVASD